MSYTHLRECVYVYIYICIGYIYLYIHIHCRFVTELSATLGGLELPPGVAVATRG
jgi:hypothetical protein